jgi:hypothetical protein
MIAMINKSVARTAVILLLISLAVIEVEVVEANPFWIYHLIEPLPGTIPPKIIMFSPQNSTVYSSDNITISFYVDKPKLDTHDSSIINITYTLDDKTVQAFTIWKNGGAGSDSGIPNFNTSVTSPSLSNGNHNLTVYAEGVLFAGGLAIFFMNSSSTTYFIIANQSPITTLIPAPTPTVPEVSWLAILPLLVLILSVAVVSRLRRKG